MDLINVTNLASGYTMATDKTGREWIVVVAKGTYRIPSHADGESQLLDEQVALVTTDMFTGEPGFSAPLYEVDFCPHKPLCDVLLHGSAYAPDGVPTERVTVALQVGTLFKSFDVVGDRTWQIGTLDQRISPTRPKPFTVLPISYNNAFGGIDRTNEDGMRHRWYPFNPAGVGYHEEPDAEHIKGTPLPNTEETGHPVEDPRYAYRPMAFGPVGRAWRPRYLRAGTYDQMWRDEKYPFLPEDFDERFFQCAPEDQQMGHIEGGEKVVLINLTPQGRTEFNLPTLKEPFDFLFRSGETKRMAGKVDTLVLEPDLGRFTLSLRACLPLQRNLHEVRRIAIGRMLQQSVRRERMGGRVEAKPRYKSLADLVAANRARKK